MSNYPPLPQSVISERLIIRPSTRADAPYLQQWWNNPAVMEPAGCMDGMQYDENDMEDWFQRYIDGRPYATHFVICLRQGKPIGEFYIACDDRPGGVCFGMVIGDTTLWGQGYAREVILAYAGALFESGCCGLMRVELPRDNQRAIHLCETIGFEVEHVWANQRAQTMILTQAAYELYWAAV